MNSLITASQLSQNVRANWQKYFTKLKELIKLDVGSIYCDGKGMLKFDFFTKYVESSWILRKKLSIDDVVSSKPIQHVSLLDFWL